MADPPTREAVELLLPTPLNRAVFAILCAQQVYAGKSPEWDRWAADYLSGKDRTTTATAATYAATRTTAASAAATAASATANAAYAAAVSASAATPTTYAATYAARAAEIDFAALVAKALAVE